MKRHLLFGLCLALLSIASCSRYPSESQRINSAFEQAQLVYGDGENDTLLFIPELDKASAYYARKKDFGKAALSALYQGYAEKDYDKVLAMEAFKDAERYGELVGDSLTMARAEYQMGRLLYYEGMNKEALAMNAKSEALFGHHYSEKVLALNGSACCYIVLQDYHEADSCLNLALSFAELEGVDEFKQKVLNNFAVLYLERGDFGRAIGYLKKVSPKNDQQKVLNLLNFGNFYLRKGDLDSAAYYLKSIEDSLHFPAINDETKVAAYSLLSWLAEKQEDFESALRYDRLYASYQYEVQEKHKQNNTYRIQEKYDYEVIENELKQEKIQSLILFLVFISLILLAIIVIVVLVLRHKRLVKKEHDLKTEIDRIKGKLLGSVDISKVEEELSWRLLLFLKMKQCNKGIQSTKNQQEVMKRYILKGNETLYDAAISTINEVYPDLQSALLRQYSNLNETEIKVCLLSINGLSNSDIADILDVSVHTVNKCRSSLYKKMEIEAGDFKSTLRELKTSLKA